MTNIILTKEEQKAIKSMQRLAKKWPKSLSLFSFSGSLIVCKYSDDMIDCAVSSIDGIRNDGGDPENVEQSPEIHYEPK